MNKLPTALKYLLNWQAECFQDSYNMKHIHGQSLTRGLRYDPSKRNAVRYINQWVRLVLLTQVPLLKFQKDSHYHTLH